MIELDCPDELRAAALAALEACGLGEGHLAVELVPPERIRELNRVHRGKDEATDVLAFPLDGSHDTAGPREIGDVVICPEETSDLEEATVHGVLHLAGYDHETDAGEMLALQGRILATLRKAGPAAGPRELGDVVLCPGHTADLVEAVVHGVLHLCGHDHEADGGEMLALQDRVVAGLRA